MILWGLKFNLEGGFLIYNNNTEQCHPVKKSTIQLMFETDVCSLFLLIKPSNLTLGVFVNSGTSYGLHVTDELPILPSL